jgi:hypothetical protein
VTDDIVAEARRELLEEEERDGKERAVFLRQRRRGGGPEPALEPDAPALPPSGSERDPAGLYPCADSALVMDVTALSVKATPGRASFPGGANPRTLP